jgi:hypothetical protein
MLAPEKLQRSYVPGVGPAAVIVNTAARRTTMARSKMPTNAVMHLFFTAQFNFLQE